MRKPKLKLFSISPLRKLLSILALSSLSACGGIPTNIDVPNAHFTYLSEGSADVYAEQFEFLVKGTSDISLATWTRESKGQICMPLQDWSAFNVMVSEICSARHINCDYQIPSTGQSMRQMFNTLFFNMHRASKRAFKKID